VEEVSAEDDSSSTLSEACARNKDEKDTFEAWKNLVPGTIDVVSDVTWSAWEVTIARISSVLFIMDLLFFLTTSSSLGHVFIDWESFVRNYFEVKDETRKDDGYG
jgi:hypothetical protein